jgi:hypothetical protein
LDEGLAGVAGEQGEQFGRIVLRTRRQEALCIGARFQRLLRTPSPLSDPSFGSHGGDRPSGPVGVELSLDDGAFNAIYEMFRRASFREGVSWGPDTPFYSTSDGFRLSGPGADVDLVLYAEVSTPLRLPDRTVWTGWLGGSGERVTGELVNGQFDFILEQHGTIEPATLLLAALFFVVFYDRDGGREAEECYQWALRVCGDAGNIKTINETSGLTGMTLRRDRGCQIECFERRPT